MIHRHLDYPPDVPPSNLGNAALDDLLDRGDLAEWRALLDAIAEDPFGDLAKRVLWLCDVNPRYGTSPLMRAWIARRRALAQCPPGPIVGLADLRLRQGLTQAEVASRIGMSQSDYSKAERRRDWKLSTIASILKGLGLRGRIVIESESRSQGTVGVMPIEERVR